MLAGACKSLAGIEFPHPISARGGAAAHRDKINAYIDKSLSVRADLG